MEIPIRLNYRTFGYIPRGSMRADWREKLMGHPNLIKRLQAPDVMASMNIRKNEVILDAGCGSGYFTYEFSKLAKKTYGLDINPYIAGIAIPEEVGGKLEFVVCPAEKTPFPGPLFDKIFASELLPMLSDVGPFLREMGRVLKPDAKLILLNGAGHPAIRDAYERDAAILRVLKQMHRRTPASYTEYCGLLQRSFGTKIPRFYSEKEILGLLREAGFSVERIAHTPKKIAMDLISWRQFLMAVLWEKTLSEAGFLWKYPMLSLLSRLDPRRSEAGILITTRREG